MDNRIELKRSYKLSPKPMGIYQIKNNANGKIFIGSSLNVDGKINSSKFQLKFGSHMNKELQHDWNLFGEANFSFDVLDLIKPNENETDYKAELEILEEIWLEKLQPYGDNGYNRVPTTR